MNMKLMRLSLLVLTALAVTFSLAECAPAQAVTFLYHFTGTQGADQGSAASIIQGTDGNFYGVGAGGANGLGRVFRMTPSGKLSTIYSFCSQPNCTDGYGPISLILGSDGNLYGIAQLGGNANNSGTFFRLTLGGKFAKLYTFCSESGCADGTAPLRALQASDGNFYGNTEYGGAGTYGTIFRISPSGEYKLMHAFCLTEACPDGILPIYPPIEANDGNFYGAANTGGVNGAGVLYKLTPDGTFTVLYSLCALPGCTDGFNPNAVVQDGNGTFFGTTGAGGLYGRGTVFEVTSTGQYTVPHSFDGVDGSLPTMGLTLANDGNLYGETELGGVAGLGSLFEITSAGAYTSLYSFAPKGVEPFDGPLFQGTDGILYGTTPWATQGPCCYGTIFTLFNDLSPLVETVPVAGKVGKKILILGNGLTGTTSVTFNGVSAEFTVESDTYIKATVPAGATTGTVQVITPTQTLNSNPAFQVLSQ